MIYSPLIEKAIRIASYRHRNQNRKYPCELPSLPYVSHLFSVALINSDGSRCYPATYTISSANTWQQITLTVAGDTGGTWLTTNGAGIVVRYDLGSGSGNNGTANTWNTAGSFVGTRTSSTVNWIATSGATFYITGVQLEKGSVATSFDQRAYSQELAMCQRYYQVYGAPASETFTMVTIRGDFFALNLMFIVAMRTTPTVTLYAATSGTAGKIRQIDGAGSPQDVTATPQVSSVGISYVIATTVTVAHYGFSLNASAEL